MFGSNLDRGQIELGQDLGDLLLSISLVKDLPDIKLTEISLALRVV